MKLISQGAEAKIYLTENKIVKDRIRKDYRIKEIDEKLRGFRTRREAKILGKLEKFGFVPKVLYNDKKEKLTLEYLDGPKIRDVIDELFVKDKKKCAVLFSGGKDSCLALHKSKEKYEIRYLLAIIPENFDSFMFHKPYIPLLEKQAEMLDIDLIIKGIKGEEDKEVDDLKELIKEVKDDVDVIVVGGIASSYQGNRIKKICDPITYSCNWNDLFFQKISKS